MSVGAKHLKDKLSVIAKNSSPNASPVQLLVLALMVNTCKLRENYYGTVFFTGLFGAGWFCCCWICACC
ncbi:MAG: hypothetical protein HEQ33_15155 [Dolichospermum sp. WA123]|nr:hypothetical protein [Dolichospermum sp. WA123]